MVQTTNKADDDITHSSRPPAHHIPPYLTPGMWLVTLDTAVFRRRGWPHLGGRVYEKRRSPLSANMRSEGGVSSKSSIIAISQPCGRRRESPQRTRSLLLANHAVGGGSLLKERPRGGGGAWFVLAHRSFHPQQRPHEFRRC